MGRRTSDAKGVAWRGIPEGAKSLGGDITIANIVVLSSRRKKFLPGKGYVLESARARPWVPSPMCMLTTRLKVLRMSYTCFVWVGVKNTLIRGPNSLTDTSLRQEDTPHLARTSAQQLPKMPGQAYTRADEEPPEKDPRRKKNLPSCDIVSRAYFCLRKIVIFIYASVGKSILQTNKRKRKAN